MPASRARYRLVYFVPYSHAVPVGALVEAQGKVTSVVAKRLPSEACMGRAVFMLMQRELGILKHLGVMGPSMHLGGRRDIPDGVASPADWLQTEALPDGADWWLDWDEGWRALYPTPWLERPIRAAAGGSLAAALSLEGHPLVDVIRDPRAAHNHRASRQALAMLGER